MKKQLVFSISYFSFWVLFFLIARIVFLVYYADKSNELDAQTIQQIFVQGIKLDFSMSAYFTLVPFIVFALSYYITLKISRQIINGLTLFLLVIVNFLMLMDLAIYEYWGIRIDVSPFAYLNTPKEMLASVTTGMILLGIAIWIASTALWGLLFNLLISKSISKVIPIKLINIPVLLFTLIAIVVVMRGGVQNSPINQSNVYFSDNMYANHAAVNFAWNFNHSVNKKAYDLENPFHEIDSTKAREIYVSSRDILNQSVSDTIQHSILNTEQPNVILIVWESLSAKIVESLGGEPSIVINFNSLINEGILFNNFYSNADRSDKGLVAILSGYYPQPHNSIMKHPSKTRSLPMLSKNLSDLGYTCSFYYGGNLNFMNMNTYLYNGKFNTLVESDSFDRSDRKSKWGVPDGILMNKVISDLSKVKSEPFFNLIFTLSSHNPFDFPGDFAFGKDTEDNKFRSSHAYTDDAVGNLVSFAKKQPWWNNTVIVIMADHGSPIPEHEGEFNEPIRFHVPMLWLGGALNTKDTIISNFCTQTDFAYSLLAMLKVDNSDYKWSKNIFKHSPNHYAYFNFNMGFGIINKNGSVVYDYTLEEKIVENGNSNEYLELLGKTITQLAYQDYLDKH